MSYYTNYNVSVSEVNPATKLPLPPTNMPRNKDLVPQKVVRTIEGESGGVAFDGIDEFTGCAKWYGWKECLVGLSKEFPGLMFTVEGAGEDNEDMWICWITDGKFQHEEKRLVHEPYDPAKLRST